MSDMSIEKQQMMKFLKIDELDDVLVIRELSDDEAHIVHEGDIDSCIEFLANTDIPRSELTVVRKRDFKP